MPTQEDADENGGAGQGRDPFTGMQQHVAVHQHAAARFGQGRDHRDHHGHGHTNTGDLEWQLVRELQRSGAVAQWRAGAVAQWRIGAVWRSLAQFGAVWRSGAVAQWRSGTVLSS